MTMLAVVFWTLAAGLAGFALDSFIGRGSSFAPWTASSAGGAPLA